MSLVGLKKYCVILEFNCFSFLFVSLAPDASPTNISSLAVKSTSITLTMSPPGKRWVNGIILGYQVTYWTSEDEAVSKNFTRTRSENETRGEISGLRKFFNHNITVKAFTRIGLGPLSDVIVVKTGEDGKCSIRFLFVNETKLWSYLQFDIG